MIDKRSRIGKMIDTDKAVWQCMTCDFKLIGYKRPEFCPRCNDKREFVLIDNLIVTK